MDAGSPATLRTLVDTGLTVANPEEDLRGRTVLDRDGEALGKIDALYVDDREQRVRFLRVATGGILGLGQTRFLVPVEAIASVDADSVRVEEICECVAGAPRYAPELSEVDVWPSLYDCYDRTPFWFGPHLYPPGPPGTPPPPAPPCHQAPPDARPPAGEQRSR
jgi:sporulation protein YlmC with PRC-barrel domain